MTFRSTTLLALLALLLVTSCELATGPDSEVRAAAEPPDLVVRNASSRAIYYFPVEQETAGLILWGPCDDPDTCRSVQPGSTIAIPLDSISGYSPSTEVVLLYWWHLVPKASGGFAADRIRVEEVHLSGRATLAFDHGAVAYR